MRNGGYRDEILRSFCEAGYKRISVNTLLASDFGVPQDRRRVFFIGVRDDLLFDNDPELHNHHTKGIEAPRLRIIEAIKPGRRGDSLPTSLCGTRAHKWRRLDPNRPAYTILAHMHRDLSEWIHPDHNRWITVREAARLQSFHDGFVFCGSEYQQLKQVGNAVPPLLALGVARAVEKLLRLANAPDAVSSGARELRC